jgi:amino acid transporter
MLSRRDECRLDHWYSKSHSSTLASTSSRTGNCCTILSRGKNFISTSLQLIVRIYVVSFMTFFVGLSMAEIVSAIPTSGGPYFWAAMLAPKKYAAFFSWLTGWFNFVGQFAVTTGISFGCAGLIATAATIKAGFVPTPGKTLGIYAAILVSHGLVNTFGVRVLRYLNNTSIILHSLGVGSLAIAVVAKAPTHLSAKEVFSHFYDGTGDPGWSVRASPAYVAICGILLSQYTITGKIIM